MSQINNLTLEKDLGLHVKMVNMGRNKMMKVGIIFGGRKIDLKIRLIRPLSHRNLGVMIRLSSQNMWAPNLLQP